MHARVVPVEANGEGQRVDNFVLRECPGVPKTRLYRAIRKGEIRVNKGRCRPDTRLKEGDEVRLPPLTVAERSSGIAPKGWQDRLDDAVIHEDAQIIVLNKPSGLAVHGGSGLAHGMIETLRAMRPESRFLELVHRLDRETSGLIVVAKKPAALRELHALLRAKDGMEKSYQAFVYGRWPNYLSAVEAPLERVERKSGERVVRVAKGGKSSLTQFKLLRNVGDCSLVEARPITGRTHQIRVHAAHVNHPILGDAKYASPASEEQTRALRLKRLFLHASRLRFSLSGEAFDLRAPLGKELEDALRSNSI